MGRRKRFFSFFRDSWGIFLRFFRGILRLYQPRSSQYALRDAGFLGLRFYRHSLFGTPFGDHIFLFYVFTGRSAGPTPFGDPLSVLTERGERATKGLRSRPLDSGFLYGGMMPDVRTLYVFAVMQLTRLSQHRRSAYPRRFSVLLQLRQTRWHSKNNQRFAYLTPSGGSIFRCTTKDRGERRAKGVATPFNPLGFMRDRILTCYVRTFSQQVF